MPTPSRISIRLRNHPAGRRLSCAARRCKRAAAGLGRGALAAVATHGAQMSADLLARAAIVAALKDDATLLRPRQPGCRWRAGQGEPALAAGRQRDVQRLGRTRRGRRDAQANNRARAARRPALGGDRDPGPRRLCAARHGQRTGRLAHDQPPDSIARAFAAAAQSGARPSTVRSVWRGWPDTGFTHPLKKGGGGASARRSSVCGSPPPPTPP